MRLKTVSLVAAAAALGTAPIAAQAEIASRDMAPVSDEGELGGAVSSQLLILVAVAAVIVAGIVITDDDDPLSP